MSEFYSLARIGWSRDIKDDRLDTRATTLRGTSEVVPALSIRTCIEASISKDERSDLVWRAVACFISELHHLSYAERRARSSGIDHDSVFASEVESV